MLTVRSLCCARKWNPCSFPRVASAVGEPNVDAGWVRFRSAMSQVHPDRRTCFFLVLSRHNIRTTLILAGVLVVLMSLLSWACSRPRPEGRTKGHSERNTIVWHVNRRLSSTLLLLLSAQRCGLRRGFVLIRMFLWLYLGCIYVYMYVYTERPNGRCRRPGPCRFRTRIRHRPRYRPRLSFSETLAYPNARSLTSSTS